MNTKTFRIFSLIGATVLWIVGGVGSPAFGYKSAGPGMLVPGIPGGRVLAGIQFDNPLQQRHRAPGAGETLLAQNLDHPSAEPAGSTAAPEISQLTTEESGAGEAIITIESTQAIQYTAFKLLNPLRLVLDFPKMGRGFLKDPIEVNKGVVDKIRPLYFDDAKVLRLEIGLNRAAGYDIQKPVKNRLVIRVREAAPEITPAPPTGPKSAAGQKMAPKIKPPTQKKVAQSKENLAQIEKDPCEPLLGGKKEKISLDFQDANVRNLFRIFSEISGFNLIISPEVNGMVNMRLLDVPWNEAFEIILANSSLGRRCLGKNIIRVASLGTLAHEEEQVVENNKRKRQKKITEKLAAELVTEVSRLNYADIKEVAKNLETLKTERGKITVDNRTNTLILTDIRDNVDDMINLVRVLDVQTPQVMIEARIVEVNKKVTQQLGVQWGLTGNLDSGGGGRGVSTLASPAGANSPFLVDLLPGGSALSSGATSGFLLGLGGLAKGVNLDIQLTALEKQGDARILSSPKVTTLDNKEARIKSGRSIPFSTVSQNGTVIQFIDFELSLTVTPHITSDDYIYMVIDATKNSANPSVIVAGFPEITTKEAHTEVLVANGDTTVLGGIYESTIKRNKEGVPFLSNIPGLGLLFRDFDDADDVDELLIFITPTVISNEASRKL